MGTVTGACLSYLGHHVTCVDTDETKIAKLKRGESPIYEPHLEAMIALAAARGGIEFTTEIGPAAAASDVIFIAVGTPPLPNGEPIWHIWKRRARHRRCDARMRRIAFRVVVNKSTVPVGSGNLVETLVREGIGRGAARRAYPFRRGQQSGVSARRQRGGGFAVSRPHRGGRAGRADPAR